MSRAETARTRGLLAHLFMGLRDWCPRTPGCLHTAGMEPRIICVVSIDLKRHYDSRMNDAREFHDGQKDGLVALGSLDLDKR